MPRFFSAPLMTELSRSLGLAPQNKDRIKVRPFERTPAIQNSVSLKPSELEERDDDSVWTSLKVTQVQDKIERLSLTASSIDGLAVGATSDLLLQGIADDISNLSDEFSNLGSLHNNARTAYASDALSQLSDRVSALIGTGGIQDPLSTDELAAELDALAPAIQAYSDSLTPLLLPDPEGDGSPLSLLSTLQSDLEAFAVQYGVTPALTDAVDRIAAQLAAADGSIDITDLQAESGLAYIAGETLAVGANVYSDRDYTFTDVGSFAGATLIQTANDDKHSAGENFVTFELDQEATVYVAYDTREAGVPEWLQSWEDTGEELASTDITTLRVYKKTFSPGEVTIGGTEQIDTNRSNYSIFLTSEAPNLEATLSSEISNLEALRPSYSGIEGKALDQIINRLKGLPEFGQEPINSVHQSLMQLTERLETTNPSGNMQELSQEVFTRMNNMIGQIQEMDESDEQYVALQDMLGGLKGLRDDLAPHVHAGGLSKSEKRLAMEVVAQDLRTVFSTLTGRMSRIHVRETKPIPGFVPENPGLDKAALGKSIIKAGRMEALGPMAFLDGLDSGEEL